MGGAVEVHREIRLTIDDSLGFDEVPGANLAIAVDESAGLALLVALKFERPFSSGDFAVLGDPLEMAQNYRVAAPVAQIADLVTTYPLLSVATTDTAGIRTMDGEITAILLEGDLQSDAPDAYYVAKSGTVTLYRNDGLYDLEGALSFIEVSALGPSASAPSEPKSIDLDDFFFEFDVGFQ
jgi:hypothetical protein